MRTQGMVAAALVLAGLMAGCGGGGETKTVTREVPAGQETATGDGEATPTPEGTAAAGGVIAEGEGSGDGGRFNFAIDELRRSGPTVVVNATVTLIAGGDDSIQVASIFGDGIFNRLESGDNEQGQVFDGIALIDPEGRKKYLVARDSTGRCVCSADLGATFVEEETPAHLEATLSAPPAEVTEVNVYVPNVKTFVGVPIAG